ncbi:alanine racemase [Pararhizobium mangrovi]|uniref:Alanine racemase n=1 Tax=Pararhizobium mangrovi TaxID=2590452 RepID=A0A506UC68_9HYPH|nr:alanine racemase [Pararhizobium mangrovi]TPW32032.1 alanine racemase [Pararhizobium mangrovi]
MRASGFPDLPREAFEAAAGARLTVDLSALRANWRMLADRAPGAETAAVVKADAYGIGIANAVPALVAEGCRTFFVAMADEGLRVRAAAPDARIFVLNGFFAGSAALYRAGDLIPVAGCRADIEAWCAETDRTNPPAFAIQVDTGMNRAGLSPAEALAYADAMRAGEAPKPTMVMTHLACADDPDNPKNAEQLAAFRTVREAFAGIEASMANSGGVLNGPAYHFDLTRPGIALYGGEAVETIANPMRPVVTLEGRITSLRHAKAGETVSYGATWTLERDSLLATCSLGYADGFVRAASGSGVPLREAVPQGTRGFVNDTHVPLVGRVTMDLTIFDVTDCVTPPRAGEHIEFFGAHVALDDVARAAGTIGYELLTGLSQRYHRRVMTGRPPEPTG